MSKLWEKDAGGSVQEVDLSALAVTSPTVVYLPGHKLRDYTPDIIRSGFDAFETLLKDDVAPLPKVYVWSHTDKPNFRNIFAYRFFPNFVAGGPAKKIARGVILPLVSDDGKPLPLAEAKERLSNLTFVGHSKGSILTEEVFNAAFRMMRKMGYPKAEAREALGAVVGISIGTVSKVVTKKKRFTSIYMTNTDDLYVRIKNRMLHPLKSIFARHARRLKVRTLTGNSLLVSAAARGKWRDRKRNIKENVMDVTLPRWSLRVTNHGFFCYANNDFSQSQMAHVMHSALVNAAQREGDVKVADLLEPAPSLTPDEKALYQKRLAAAKAAR